VSRIIAWDEKWVYIISHFIKKGAFNPTHFSDQPGKTRYADVHAVVDVECQQDDVSFEESRSAVLAIAMARLVFKTGHTTVPPAQFLQDCGLIPALRDDFESASSSNSDDKGAANHEHAAIVTAIEERRRRGLAVAQNINSLDDGICFFGIHEDNVYSKF